MRYNALTRLLNVIADEIKQITNYLCGYHGRQIGNSNKNDAQNEPPFVLYEILIECFKMPEHKKQSYE